LSWNTHQEGGISVTQSHELIGNVSPLLDKAWSEHQGWDSQPPEPLGFEQVDATDFSQADIRGNRQILGATGTPGHATFCGPHAAFPMADHSETPMAAQPVTPPGSYSEVEP
jgi:hypothetical protein